jgi:hypothetical protein
MDEEELDRGPKPKASPKVSIGSVSSLFSADAKDFSLRKEVLGDESVVPIQARDWKQIALDFLSKSEDIEPLGATEPFDQLDVSRMNEFVCGHSAHKWSELRKVALDDSKEKRRRAKK